MSAEPDDASGHIDSADGVSDAILHAILEEMDSESGVDVADLQRRFPDHAATVDRLCRAASEYRALRSAMAPPCAEPEALPRGTAFGDFEIESLLGRGGMGAVYRARQLSLGRRQVALKVQTIDDVPDRTLRRFRREALAAAKLHSAHLAEVYGFGTEGKHLYYAMRLIDGPSLREVLERLALEPELRTDPRVRRRIVAMVTNIAAALEVVHDAGLVHRDVKPSNIMLQARPEPRGPVPEAAAILVDFGLVQPVTRHTRTERGVAAATPSYASPEQLLGFDTDPRSDVFSLGATLHDLLTARLPSARPQAAHGLESLRSLEPSIDDDLVAVVAKATELDARWRYQNGRELRLDLQRWLDREPVLARRISVVERARRFAQRHPARVLRATALAALVGFGVWCAAGVVRFFSLRAQAQAALTAGDVATLVDSLRALPSLPARSLPGDPVLAELRSRVDNVDDPLPMMRDAIARGDLPAALVTAATRLRTAGTDSETLLARWLGAQVLLAAGESQGTRHQTLATILCARLLFECPSLGALDSKVGACLREALLRRFADPTTERFERWYVLSALGSCATPEHLAPIVDWMAKQPTVSEETRLGLMATEGIVRRALASRHQDDVQYREVWSGLAPHLAALLSREREGSVFTPLHKDVIVAAIRLRRTLLLAQRASRWAASAAADLVSVCEPDELVALNAPPSCELPALPIEWMIVTGDSGRIRQWEVESLVCFDNWAPSCTELGWGIGAMLDADLVQPAREFMRRRADRDPVVASRELDEFDIQRLRGVSECSGEWTELAPDPNTLLGAPLPEFRLLRAVPGPGLESSVALTRYLPSNDPTMTPSLAQWELRTEPAVMTGAARALDGQHVEWRPEGVGGYLRFGRFGTSEARFEFELEVGGTSAPLDLCLWHQLGARSHYPAHGSVLLEVALDGGVLAVLSVPTIDPVLSTLRLAHARLATGRHVVRIRQLESSTTTYRLLWLGLRIAKQ